jgi:hypothetical protein
MIGRRRSRAVAAGTAAGYAVANDGLVRVRTHTHTRACGSSAEDAADAASDAAASGAGARKPLITRVPTDRGHT